MIFNELILKVSSCCNLNCKYCYVFNQGDTSYQNEPAIINDDMIIPIVNRIKEHCEAHDIKTFLVIFHGGEPLMVPKEFYNKFISCVRNSIKGTEVLYGLQTNGTLLTQSLFSYLDKLEISIGVSLDGPEKASRHRVYRHSGKNAYSDIIKGINIIKENGFPVNILSVINTEEDPYNIYSHIKENNISNVDFLFPDIRYDSKPPHPTGEWLIKMFDLWYDDKDMSKPMIRYFDTIVGLLMGVERGYEVLGRKTNKTISIKPNGNLELVDNLKICGNGFTNTGLNIANNSFDDISQNEIMNKYYHAHSDSVLCKKCRECIIKKICGGGNLAHRYSKINGFNNPSAYCDDILSLVSHIQNRLMDDLPEVFNDQTVYSIKELVS